MPSFGDIVVDVGASIGAFCIRSSLIVGEKGKVIAIEPEPNSFKILDTNIKANKLSNVLCLNLALSNKEGYENLHIKSDIPYWSSFKKDMLSILWIAEDNNLYYAGVNTYLGYSLLHAISKFGVVVNALGYTDAIYTKWFSLYQIILKN
jgi:hypothetical protein